MKRLLAALALLCGLMQAQVAQLAPPKLQFFDSSGNPLAAGCVWTYQSGTNTPQATYTDSTQTYQNANPVVLDGGGFAQIWLSYGQTYTIAVFSDGGVPSPTCAFGTQQYSINGISGIPSSSSVLTVIPQANYTGGSTIPNTVHAASINTATGGFTVAVPAASSNVGDILYLFMYQTAASPVTLVDAGGGSFKSTSTDTSYQLSNQGQYVILISTGSFWGVLGN